MGFVKRHVLNGGIVRLCAVALVVWWVLLLAGCLSPAPARLACAQEDEAMASGTTQLWVRLDGDGSGRGDADASSASQVTSKQVKDADEAQARESTQNVGDKGLHARSAFAGHAPTRAALAKTADRTSPGVTIGLAVAGALVLAANAARWHHAARLRRVLCACVTCCLVMGLAVGPTHAGVARTSDASLESMRMEGGGGDARTEEASGSVALISFDANGGAGSMETVSVWTLGDVLLPACSFARDGFVFAGWDVRANRELVLRLWPQARDGDTLRVGDRASVGNGTLTCSVMRDGERVGEARARLVDLAQDGKVELVAAWVPKEPGSARPTQPGDASRGAFEDEGANGVADKATDKADVDPSETEVGSADESSKGEGADDSNAAARVAEDIGVAVSEVTTSAAGGQRAMRTVTLLSAVEGQDVVAVDVAEGEGRVPQCPFAWDRHAFVDWVVVGRDQAHVVPGEQLPAGDVTLRARWEKRGPESMAEGLDFSSCRLIVGSQEQPPFGTVISEHEGVWLLSFDDAVDAAWAYADHVAEVDFMAPDIQIEAAGGDGEVPEAFADPAFAGATDAATDSTSNPSAAPPLQAAIEEAVVPHAPALPEAGPLGDKSAGEDGPVADLACSNVRAGAYEGAVGLVDTGVNGHASNVVARLSAIDSFAYDDNGHGTSMVETMLAMEPQTRVVSIRALDATGKGSAASVYAAIQTAIRAGCKAVNLSLCAPAVEGNAAVEQAICDAHAAGVMVVGAAGNDGRDAKWYVPGKMGDQAVIVGSCDVDGKRNATSNFGDTVDLYVPSASTSYASAKVAAWLVAHAAFGHELEALHSPEAQDALAYVTEVERGDSDLPAIEDGESGPKVAWTHPSLQIRIHYSYMGWKNWVNTNESYPTTNGTGDTATSYNIKKGKDWQTQQNVAFTLNNGSWTGGGGLQYQVYQENHQDTGWVNAPNVSPPTTGTGLRMEGIYMRLTGALASAYNINYKIYTSSTSSVGWSCADSNQQHKWHSASNGGYAGTKHLGVSTDVTRAWLTPKSLNQTVQVRYQNANGTWGAYGNVINTGYATGSAVSWSRAQDATYNAASISYTVTSANTKQISVARRSATNTIQVRYQNADGTWSAYATVSSGSDLVGATRSWSRAQDATYKAVSATITGTATAQTKKVDVARRTYTLKFAGNGATGGSMGARTLYVGQQTVLPASAFTYGGRTCVGWNTASNGTGAAYALSASAKDLASADQTVTLYAQWRINSYRVAFDANAPDATGRMDEVSATYDTPISLPQNGFVRELYSFNAWNTEADGSGTWIRNAQEVKNLTAQDGACVTLYAQWNTKQMRMSVPAAIHFVAQDDGVMVGPDDDVARIANQGEVTMRLGEVRTELEDSTGFGVGFEVPDRPIGPGESVGMSDVRGNASVPVGQERQIGCIHWTFVLVT
ncbi:MAG: InlB B-repeat-containing protein [Atopobiaceae bacterium]|nr:InlB B-repeat-containing protein [Atopobiaceae bacterium]